ncbi:MAG: sulfatase-like hydrolase/transferase [Acidimicrobiia bacterium]|nr:sulfatase-like hydrolase/transferase [Acidimicrobiia bacterium]
MDRGPRGYLFTLLAPSHDLTAFESLTYLCGLESCEGEGGATGGVSFEPRVGDLVSRAVDVWRERVSLSSGGVRILDDFEEQYAESPNALEEVGDLTDMDAVRNRPTRLTAFTETLEEASGPTLHYLHLLMPHHPWRFHPDGTVYEPPAVPNIPQLYPFSYDNEYGDWASALSEQRHLLQAEYTDRLVGEILDELRSSGRYDESLVVVTADHGASFLPETPVREVTEENIGSIAYTPLLVKAPGQTEPEVDDSNLQAMDLLPTIAEIVGVEIPWEIDGAAAGSPGSPDGVPRRPSTTTRTSTADVSTTGS